MRLITQIALLFLLGGSIAWAAPALPPTGWEQNSNGEAPVPLTEGREVATRTLLLGGLGLLAAKAVQRRGVRREIPAES